MLPRPQRQQTGRRRRRNGAGQLTAKGYISVHVDHRNRFLHRLIMEELLGRRLAPWETVHHLDGNPQNNQPANLRLLSRAAHNIEHKRKYPLVAWCPRCGRPFLNQAATRGHLKRCCSISCGQFWRRARARAARRGLPPPAPARKLPIPEARPHCAE